MMSMDSQQLIELVKQGESQHLEFKKSTASLKEAFQTICAFLNSNGGILLFGVKDNGQLIGQDFTDTTKQEIAREMKKIESPANTLIDVQYILLPNEKSIIAFNIKAGTHAPYTYDGRPYIRVQSTTELMTQHLYEQLLVRRGQLNHNWEKQYAEGYDIDSLDHDEIRRTIIEGINQNRVGTEVINYDIEHILTNLKLIQDGKLINAAVVLYAKDVEPKYSQCMIRMARFRGIDKMADYIDNQRVYGNAFQLIAAANEFALRHLPIASFFEHGKIQRTDQPAVPMLALREALINAINHRDYTNGSASIAFAIYDDRLEIWNNGQLTPQLTIEDLRKLHQSYPRNETIATIFFKRGWVEGWGTGTTRMIGYCKNNNTPEPEFQEYSGGFAVVFPFKNAMGGANLTSSAQPHALNDRQKQIMDIITTHGKLSISDISEKLNNSFSIRTIQRELSFLKEIGLIEKIGKSSTTLWIIKD
jgi:ATP-dependent DNA helicase RecG